MADNKRSILIDKINNSIKLRGSIMKLTNAEVIKYHREITNKELTGSCSGCVRRKGIRIILNYLKL